MYKTYIKKIVKLLKDIKEDLHKWRYTIFVVHNNIIKMSFIPKLMYSSVQFIKILAGLCVWVSVSEGRGATMHV